MRINPNTEPKAMATLIDKKPRRKAVNLTVNEDLLRQAKALKINLSRSFEQHLADLIAKAERDQWLAENRRALKEYGDYVERRGVFSEGLRRF